MNDLPWPLMVLDFEASGLSADSYPIEVGVCLWRSPADPLEGWSTLIRPTGDWLRDGEWSVASQTIHGIDRGDLDGGLTPTDTVSILDSLLDCAHDRTVWVDGGPFDLHWAKRLAAASSAPLRMKIGDFDALAGRLGPDGYRDLVKFIDRSPIPHRARADAERMVQAIAHGLGFGAVERRDLSV